MFKGLFFGICVLCVTAGLSMAQDMLQDVHVDEAVYGQIIDRDFISRDDVKLYKHAFQALKENNYGEVD